MQNRGVGAKFADIGIRYPIIETHPNSKQHVAVMHGHIRFIGAMHAQHAKKLLV